MTFERTYKVLIELTASEVVEAFWDLDADAQAYFFNELALKPSLCFQLQYIADSETLNAGGRNAMAMIGEYAEAKR